MAAARDKPLPYPFGVFLEEAVPHGGTGEGNVKWAGRGYFDCAQYKWDPAPIRLR